MIDIFVISTTIFIILIFACGVRVCLGPTNADQMLSLDVINTLVVIIMMVLSIRFKQPGFVDVAIVYSLLSFVGTLYIAKLINGDFK